jgi:hypothetical protein
MRFARSACSVFAVLLGFVFIVTTLRPIAAEEPYKAQIDALRRAMEKYKDYTVAVRDLYLSTVGCVHYSGEKMAGHMHYPKGAMGVHFVNLTIRGAPDPMKPNILIYEPVGKELRLVAVEWLVPLTGRLFSANPSMVRWKDTNPSFPNNTCTMICTLGCSKIIRLACSYPRTRT